jgi:hypothetical protein
LFVIWKKEESVDQGVIQDLLTSLGQSLPTALAAIGILIGGWLVAWIASAVVRAILRRARLDERLYGALGDGPPMRMTAWIGTAVFWLIMLFVLVAFLQTLNLSAAAQPINTLLDQILAFLPVILGAVLLLVVAWIVASAVRFIITRVLGALKLEERLSSQAEIETAGRTSLAATLGNVAYWLVFVLFLPAVLGALNLQGLLGPVEGMVNQILGVLPNLLGAVLILLIGWLAARIVRQIVVNLLAGTGVDDFGDTIGVTSGLGGVRLSSVIGTIVYILVLIPVITAALNALAIEAVTAPVSQMLTVVFTALPAIFGAFVLLGIAYAVARVVGNFVTTALTGIGFNKVLSWIGLGPEMSGDDGNTPSQVVGYLATVAIMILAVIQAAEMLGFTMLAGLATQFLGIAGQVLVALVIFGVALYLASLADRIIRSTSGPQARILAPAARVAIVVFGGSLALRQLGIAEDIVNLAFGLVLGAIAVAAALAFGLGSREIAGREVERWLESMRKR